ncbi:hypothetical protein [Streptomyces formicae]|uniref:Ku domain protein n=1 Tax=Streptomyces formicae TaxID=1616117 RepID=A0ABY3WNU5_9ACTN|nr:hypothetical protein [Streptomyces formicae]UNM13134.1 hypothetical protein J4032_17990 [Streptomyces formicae]
MRWPDEIRDSSELAPPATQLSDDELEGALALMETMTADAFPALHDEYRHALEEVIAAKAEGKAAPAAPEPAEPAGQVVDLMAALSASVEKAREQRGEATVHEMPTKRAAKKAPAKKAAAKKTTGKSTAKKPAARRKPRSA